MRSSFFYFTDFAMRAISTVTTLDVTVFRMNKRVTVFHRSAIILALLLGFASTANATLPSYQCALTAGHPLDQPSCPTTNPDQAVTMPIFDAARSDPGLAGPPIDVWGICRYVDNDGKDSLFVPFRTAPEWQSFVEGHPKAEINLVTCSRPGSVNVPSDYPTYPNPTGLENPQQNPWYNAGLACDTAQENSVSLPYARTGTQITATTQFTCAADGQAWTQTATATFTAGTAPDCTARTLSGGWELINVVYSGTKSTPPPPPPAPSPATPPAPPPAPCPNGGQYIGGYCWVLLAGYETCDEMCAIEAGSSCNADGMTYAQSNSNWISLLSSIMGIPMPTLLYQISMQNTPNDPSLIYYYENSCGSINPNARLRPCACN